MVGYTVPCGWNKLLRLRARDIAMWPILRTLLDEGEANEQSHVTGCD